MKIPSPLPYDVRWCTQLLSRDVKTLKAKCTSKIKSRFTPKAAKTSPPLYQQIRTEPAIIEPEALHNTPELSIDEEPSFCHNNQPQQPLQPTMYEVLEALHRLTYARAAPCQHREDYDKYRGSWLLLQRAIQACPTNPIYDMFRDQGHMPDDSQLLLDVIKLSVLRHSNPTCNKISEMPAEVYTNKRGSEHLRVDSTMSTISFAAKPAAVPSPPELWHTLLEGVVDPTKTVEVGEYLLGQVWPERHAADTLHLVGAIGSRFSEAEDEDLRARLRALLLPEAKTFGMARPMTGHTENESQCPKIPSETADTELCRHAFRLNDAATETR